MSEQNNRNYLIAVTLMLLSGTGFATMNLFIRLAGDLPSMQKTFFRNAVVFVVALFVVLRENRGRKKWIRTKSEGFWLLVRSLFGLIGVLANFYAVDRIPIANASVLNKLSPFFTIIFAALFLREKVNKIQIASILIAFAGVLILSRPDVSAMAQLFPTLIGVLGGLAAGAAYTTIRHMAKQGTDGSLVVLFFSAFSCVALLPNLLFNYHPMTPWQWLCMFLLGIGAMVGQYGITFAYKYAPPAKISIFDYFNVIITTLLGIFVLNQYPTKNTIIGAAVVFSAFLLMYLYNQREYVKSKKNAG